MADENEEIKQRIKDVSKRYDVSYPDAYTLINIFDKYNLPVERAGPLIAEAKIISKEKNIPISVAIALAEKKFNLTRMISKKKTGTKDRRDTQWKPTKFSDPSMFKLFPDNENSSVQRREVVPRKGEFKSHTTGEMKKEKRGKEIPRFIPVYHHQQGEVPSFRPLPKPRYYYFSLDGVFNGYGHEEPPQLDPEFKINKAKFIPYIKVSTVHVVQASKYPKPKLNEHGKVVTDKDGNIIFEKSIGERTVRYDYYVGDTYIKTVNRDIDYEDDAIFNEIKARKKAMDIMKELELFTQEYGNQHNAQVKKLYEKAIEKRRLEDEYKGYYGDTSPKLIKFVNLYQKKGQAAIDKKNKEIDEKLPAPVYKQIDGKWTKVARKKKVNKIKAARKKIIKRKIAKKPIKRCVCKKKVVRRIKK
jgi:hypothetical protein